MIGQRIARNTLSPAHKFLTNIHLGRNPLRRLAMNSRELLELYRMGNSEAATAIFDRYVARLFSLARSRIGRKLQRRIDAEDVVQSSFRSFFVHADRYQLTNSGDLWRLLASITLHKLHGQVSTQTAAKRTVDREEPGEISLASVTAPEPSAAEVVGVVEELQRIIASLATEERLVLERSLQGQPLREISNALGKSERTARRILAVVKQKIERRLLGDTNSVARIPRHTSEPRAPLKYTDYTLERMLGVGGMGRVFRAREKATGKTLAIKALHKSRQTDERAVAQFVQEAQILANLQHPNIVGVQGLGRFPAGGYFIVMEFIDGMDLQRRQQTDSLIASDVFRIVSEIATAIQFAHDKGVIHCDLKPENILLDKNDRVLVTDFGFAYLIAGSSTVPRQNIGGTLGYIAPEILRRQSEPTSAADIYAMGMLLYTLVTGNSPSDYHPLSKIAEPHPTAFSIYHKCLAEHPSARYQSANDLIHDLRALGTGREDSPR